MRTRSVRPSPRQVGQIDGLRAVGEDEPRAFLFVEGLGVRCSAGPKPCLGQRRIPGEDLVFGDEDVGVAVAGRGRRISGWGRPSANSGREVNGVNGSQLCVVRCVRRNRAQDRQVHQIELAVARQVEELRAAAS